MSNSATSKTGEVVFRGEVVRVLVAYDHQWRVWVARGLDSECLSGGTSASQAWHNLTSGLRMVAHHAGRLRRRRAPAQLEVAFEDLKARVGIDYRVDLDERRSDEDHLVARILRIHASLEDARRDLAVLRDLRDPTLIGTATTD